jgi:hypothetical protein
MCNVPPDRPLKHLNFVLCCGVCAYSIRAASGNVRGMTRRCILTGDDITYSGQFSACMQQLAAAAAGRQGGRQQEDTN